MLKALALCIGVVITAVAVVAVLHRLGHVRLNEPDSERFPIRGIDVSHHQGEIDWSLVATSGTRFAFIKATEGQDFRDRRFEFNWARAGAEGIARAAYHFFTFCSPGAAQAAHFLRVAPPEPGALPPIADVEFTGNCQAWTDLGAIRTELRHFLDVVEEAWGVRPLLYLTPRSHEQITVGHFDEHPGWIRDILWRPRDSDYGGWAFWQFSDDGRVPGIEGPVDLNVVRAATDLKSFRR